MIFGSSIFLILVFAFFATSSYSTDSLGVQAQRVLRLMNTEVKLSTLTRTLFLAPSSVLQYCSIPTSSQLPTLPTLAHTFLTFPLPHCPPFWPLGTFCTDCCMAVVALARWQGRIRVTKSTNSCTSHFPTVTLSYRHTFLQAHLPIGTLSYSHPSLQSHLPTGTLSYRHQRSVFPCAGVGGPFVQQPHGGGSGEPGDRSHQNQRPLGTPGAGAGSGPHRYSPRRVGGGPHPLH